MKQYLIFDTETTGIKDSDLLTGWFGVFDQNFNLLDSLDIKTKPDNGVYSVNAQALEVNKIDLIKHDKEALPYKEIKPHFYNFLKKNSKDGSNKLTPLGQNVIFDINTITRTIISENSWSQFVSRRFQDTMVIAGFLQDLGKLPPELGISLGNLIKTLDIQVVGNPHESKYDALATMRVYQKLKALV